MERTVPQYLRWHRSVGHSGRTVWFYETTLDLLRRWLETQGHSTKIDDLHISTVRDWIAGMQERELSPATIASRVRAVKAFAHWLAEEELLERDPLRKLKVPRVGEIAKATLTPDDVDRLLATCDRKTLIGLRDSSLMLLLFSTGLRAAEICGLRVGDIDWKKGLIIVRRGKGGKFRVVPLGQGVERALHKYLAHKARPNTGEDGFLFLTDDGRPLAYTGLKEMLRRHGNKAGIDANAHKWRHSAAVAYLRNGGRLEHLRLLLGHAEYRTTLGYARLAGTDVAEAHANVDPTKTLKHR